eukprot:jgi/Antlo1/1703/992
MTEPLFFVKEKKVLWCQKTNYHELKCNGTIWAATL